MKTELKKTLAFKEKPKAKLISSASTPVKRKARSAGSSDILLAIHETVADLHSAKVVKTETMREFDELCLEPIVKFGAKQIAELRAREKVSQPVFAKYLNVSKSSVSQWESGEKNPDGAALKLLNLVKKRGLEVLA